ncbi:MAG TPA: polyhydroxyalkanoate synthesis regulator DNA-binding domain-containing protein [Phycisphaerales bacterium]|nr:polyhydroxyalkanoate synthesis regulator DNA-binding domain-containing protein [Phycisphaerales bacterium]HMP37711.1 polyhydroxyalkanoate synthesis regulator DNA-binding domain-containing protein [Phycisphaerales bacterium]
MPPLEAPGAPPPGTAADGIRRIQKYPNRRLYDRSTSSHLTHEELYELVASGERVQVVDSRTGEDITTVVLALVLIEHDPPKFAAIPPEFMHLLIRANRGVLPALQRSMLDAMSGAAASWIAWQERMASMIAPATPRPLDWFMGPLGGLGSARMRAVAGPAPDAPHDRAEDSGDPADGSPAPIDRTAALGAELAALRAELEELRRAQRGHRHGGGRQVRARKDDPAGGGGRRAKEPVSGNDRERARGARTERSSVTGSSPESGTPQRRNRRRPT